MKKSSLLLSIATLISFSSCKKQGDTEENGTGEYLYESSTTININTQMTQSLGVEYDWSSVKEINTTPGFLKRLEETTELSPEELTRVTSVEIDREGKQLILGAKAQSSDDALELIETYSGLFVEYLNRNERSYLEVSLKNLDAQVQRQKEIVDQNRAKLEQIYEETRSLDAGKVTLEKDRLTFEKAKAARDQFLKENPDEAPPTE